MAQVKQLELLRKLFSEIYIPDGVYNEVVIKGEGEVGSEETKDAIKEGWIIRESIRDEVAVNALSSILGGGESEVIVLYKELSADYAVIDERTARDRAELMDVDTIGVIGIIDLAIDRGFNIDKKKLIGQLKEMGFRISERLYKKMFPDSEQ